MSELLEILKEKVPVWVTIVLVLIGIAAKPLYDSVIARDETHSNKVAERKFADFNSLSAEMSAFNQMLQPFTLTLQSNKIPASETRDKMVESLVKQYDEVKKFSAYVSDDDKKILEKYKSSINDTRRQLLETSKYEDLDPFYMTLKQYEEAKRDALKVIESHVSSQGMTLGLLSQ